MSPKPGQRARSLRCTTSSTGTVQNEHNDRCDDMLLRYLCSSYDFEEVASKTASAKTFAFYSTAATDCWTRDMNTSFYKRIWFRPRVMRDVATIDTSSSILGHPVNVPLFICPTGLAKMINPEGEKGLARAAKSTGIIEIVRSTSSHALSKLNPCSSSQQAQATPYPKSSPKPPTTPSSSNSTSTKTGPNPLKPSNKPPLWALKPSSSQSTPPVVVNGNPTSGSKSTK